jgi:nucleotide-binding universal stress UspA family protein
MIAIRTVVCPVDFSAATARQIELAVDVCRAFGARLVLHHNVTDVSVGAGVGWMWHADHAEAVHSSADEKMRALLRLVPEDIDRETCITRGGVNEGVMAVIDAAGADLVILSAHTGKTDDHASVIENLLEHSNHAVLALHEAGEDAAIPSFRLSEDDASLAQALLVPVSLTADAHPQVAVACDLARLVPLRLHLLHVIEPRPGRAWGDDDLGLAKQQMDALVPGDLKSRTSIHLEMGEAVGTIVQWARRVKASCIMMGEHTRMPVVRWLKRDTSRAVLHRARCPVWYVPSKPAEAMSLSRLALSNEKSKMWGNV